MTFDGIDLPGEQPTFRGCPPGECSHCDRDREFAEQPRSQEAAPCAECRHSRADHPAGPCRYFAFPMNCHCRAFAEQPRSQEAALRIASTNYGAWLEIECVQMCGWKPAEQRSMEAVRHVKETGHETAVKHHSSIHYHVRTDVTSDIDKDDRR